MTIPTIPTIPAKPAIKVPVFQLYGEKGQLPAPDRIHCESIASRSRLHNWEINPHRHHGLFQVLWLEQGEANFQLDGQQGQALTIAGLGQRARRVRLDQRHIAIEDQRGA